MGNMKPFFIITREFNGRRPLFNVSGLSFSQKRYVDKTLKLFTEKVDPKFDKKPPNLAFIMYLNDNDFSSSMMDAHDPIKGEKELQNLWNQKAA